MSAIVCHPSPCCPPTADTTTMTVDLASFGMAGRFERLQIDPSPRGGFVVSCLPFFTYGIGSGDLVSIAGDDHRFGHVIAASGLRTLRIAVDDSEHARRQHVAFQERIEATALPHEWLDAGYLAVLIRNVAEQQRVLLGVDEAIGAGAFHWEVDPEPFAEGDAFPGVTGG